MVRPAWFTRHYTLGLVGGIGFGLFLALALAEDGDLAPGILPGSAAWKALKFGGLVLAAVAGVWYARSRTDSTPGAEPGPAATRGRT